MKIVVCIKQVPDTNEVKLDPVTNTLKREGLPSIINPDDKAALEAALAIKDADGSHITVISMGPPQAENALREALAMGADEAILVSDRAFGGADTFATSYTISQAIRKLEYDLIIAGRQAIDGDTAQVGPQIAEHMGIPQISYTKGIKIDGDHVIIEREFEDRVHVLKVKMPCLITVLAELNVPRYMSVVGVFDAFREKEVKKWSLEDIKEGIDLTWLGLKGSPTKVIKSFTKEVKPAGVKVEAGADEAVAAIVELLAKKNII